MTLRYRTHGKIEFGLVENATGQAQSLEEILDSVVTDGIPDATITKSGALTARPLPSAAGDFLTHYDFGIKADGSTDDTDALAELTSYLSENSGVVHLPPGTIVFDTWTLPTKGSILGYGMGRETILKPSGQIKTSAKFIWQEFGRFIIDTELMEDATSACIHFRNGMFEALVHHISILWKDTCRYGILADGLDQDTSTAAAVYQATFDHIRITSNDLDGSGDATISDDPDSVGLYLRGDASSSGSRANINRAYDCYIGAPATGYRLDNGHDFGIINCKAPYTTDASATNRVACVKYFMGDSGGANDPSGLFSNLLLNFSFDSTPDSKRLLLENGNASFTGSFDPWVHIIACRQFTDAGVNLSKSGGATIDPAYQLVTGSQIMLPHKAGSNRTLPANGACGVFANGSNEEISFGAGRDGLGGRIIASTSDYARSLGNVANSGGVSAAIGTASEFRIVTTSNGTSFTKRMTVTAGSAIKDMATSNSSVGTFTMGAAATTAVANTAVTASSIIILSPLNSSAALLMASKGVWPNRSAGVGFTATVQDASSAAGTEVFSYFFVN